LAFEVKIDANVVVAPLTAEGRVQKQPRAQFADLYRNGLLELWATRVKLRSAKDPDAIGFNPARLEPKHQKLSEIP
jgi:hypothetical protein